MTAVAPSSTGTTAATRAPKAMSKTSKVTGSERRSARCRSLFPPLLLLLSSRTVVTCVPPAAATDARRVSVEKGRSMGPATRAECPRAETDAVTGPPRVCPMLAATLAMAARKVGSATLRRSLCR